MLSDLMRSVYEKWYVTDKPLKVFAWTDSQIVLYYLRGDTNRWNIFVSNRVNRILQVIPIEQWFHVPTDSNPADLATRGLSSKEILKNSLWWGGPQFLSLDPMIMPPQPKNFSLDPAVIPCQPDLNSIEFDEIN